MKKFAKNFIISIFVLSFIFALGGRNITLAATTPAMGTAGSYGVLSSTFTSNVGVTGVTGDVGYTTLSGSGTILVVGATNTPAPGQAGTDQGAALANLDGQSCTSLGTNVVLSGTYTPGCYSSSGTMDIVLSTTVTLNGAGTYIFRSGGAITTGANSIVTLSNGASSCDVFWTPNGGTTLGANSTFIGTVIPVAQDIIVGNLTNWIGRALTFGHTVTTDTATIDATCTTAPVTPQVSVSSGNGMPFVVPIISVLKVPTPLALPGGPGVVTYNYAVSNIGPIAMSNILVSDDKCSAVVFLGGDVDSDSMLDISEIWNYRCVATLSETSTNTVTATGQANGITSIDTANATVAVGVSIVAPLIHVVKIPNVFFLPAGGGVVTYTYTVTNPGTVPLQNVSITDDKCTGLPGRVSGHPGDINQNNLLESNETWSFTCQTNLLETTTNTGTALGVANGLIATDFALATVIVAIPAFPKTGFPPEGESASLSLIILTGVAAMLVLFFLARKKQRTWI